MRRARDGETVGLPESTNATRISRRSVLAAGGMALAGLAGASSGVSTVWSSTARAAEQSSAPLFEQQDLFSQGQDGVNTYRIPALAVTNEGTVLVVADARQDDSSDVPGNIDVVLRRSTDGGESWGPIRYVADYPEDVGAGDPSVVVDRATGRVFVFFVYAPPGIGFFNSQPGSNDTEDPDTLHAYLTYSDDDGLSWSQPRDLNPQIKDPEWAGLFASSGHGIQTSAGRLIQPYVIRDADGIIRAFNAYSDDHGESWQAGSLTEGVGDENKAVELTDGTIMQNVRRNGAGTRYVSYSDDGGATLGPLAPEPELIDPGVNADVIRYDEDNASSRAQWLLFSNPASTTDRVDLTIRLSRDEGESWPVSRLLNSGPSGYSAMAVLPDGTVGVFYERGDTDYFETLTFARFNFEWLEGESS